MSNKWLLLVVSCSALDESFIKDHEKLTGEMKEPRVWVGAWLGEGMPNVTQGRKSLSFDVQYTLGHFRPQLHYLIFSSLRIVLSYPFVVLSCPVFADRQTIRDQTDIQTHALITENG